MKLGKHEVLSSFAFKFNLRRYIVASMMFIVGISVTYRGTKHLREARGKEVVHIFNHISYLDPLVLVRLCAPTARAYTRPLFSST